jgi:hypothetical protein
MWRRICCRVRVLFFFFRESCLCVADLLISSNREGDQYLFQAD